MKLTAVSKARRSKEGYDPQAYQKNKCFEIFHDNERDKEESCTLKEF
jgi:hypothetical protein